MTQAFDMPPASAGFAARGSWLIGALAGEFGLTRVQAAGIVGNLGFESGGFRELQELAPTVAGSAGGYGWAQWTGPRRRAFEAWCAENGLAPASDEANFGYLCVELHGAFGRTITALKSCGTVETAVWSFGQTYERPGGTTPNNLPGYSGRLDYANQALAYQASKPSNVSVLPAPPDTTDPVVQAVIALQNALNDAGATPRLVRDGDLGSLTAAAYTAYRNEH